MLPLHAITLALLCAAAPATERPSPWRAVSAAHRDIERIAANDAAFASFYDHLSADEKKLYDEVKPDAPNQRYFWFYTTGDRLPEFLVQFCYHLNKLSFDGRHHWPVFIAPDVARIDVSNYKWDVRDKLGVWEKTAAVDVFFHADGVFEKDAVYRQYWPGGDAVNPQVGYSQVRAYNDVERKAGEVFRIPAYAHLPAKSIDRLRELTYSESPILCAEWFHANTCRQVSIRNEEEGFGYNDWLGIRNRNDFFKLTGVNVKEAEALLRQHKAAVLQSGVSQQNRLVIRYGATSGAVWGTLDTKKQLGDGEIARRLRNGEYLHDAEEWFGYLPNGLDVTALIQAVAGGGKKAGDAVASAPDFIGGDYAPLHLKLKPQSRDARIHSNLSCVRCHCTENMLKDVNDWARKTFKKGGMWELADPSKKVKDELANDYLRDIGRLLTRDREDYEHAYTKVTTSKLHPGGVSVVKLGTWYAEAHHRYVDRLLDLDACAAELGVSPEALARGIKLYASRPNRGIGDNVLATLLVEAPNNKISRLSWEGSYGLAMILALGFSPPDLLKTVNKRDVFKVDDARKEDKKPAKKETKKDEPTSALDARSTPLACAA